MDRLIHIATSLERYNAHLKDLQSEVALQTKKLVDQDPSMARPFLTHAPAKHNVIKGGC